MTNRIKEMRKKKGLSQKEFAKAFNEFAPSIKNISYATISRWENGKNEPKLSTWSKLAEFFDVPISYIQGLEDYQVTSEKDFTKIMHSTLAHSSHDNLKDNLNFLDKMQKSMNKDREIKNSVSLINTLFSSISNFVTDDEKEEMQNYINSINDPEELESLRSDLITFFKIIIQKNTGNNELASALFDKIQNALILYNLVDVGIYSFDHIDPKTKEIILKQNNISSDKK